MDDNYAADQEFTNLNFKSEKLIPEYENCHFKGCTLSNLNLGGIIFSECEFEDCDFSSSTLKGTSFRDCSFRNCKLLGLRFEECSDFLLSFSFESCDLSFSSFFQLKIKKIQFLNSKLEQVEFSGADLTGANFAGANLSNASFRNSILEGADFRKSDNISLDPEHNRLKNAKFSLENLPGLLSKYALKIS
ncbi:pentapeptide repeat-containing protein [Salegentibacter sp. F188]|uniref:Pentapeptide repeat-containing protein n=1 Tax=Autumnicola patrickiae TaxID=3075591 RepID=A0ABU3DXG0_9FLAO|nr:pentapeptide repeat-containing protein [Salegentibacter sp. F188]MDT0688397.1 pentapeptide repeat-containing protein [Salegentibacter sp. F188]